MKGSNLRRKDKMNEYRIKEFCEKLIAERSFPYKKEDIIKTWAPVKASLTEEEQIALLNCLVQRDSVWMWFHLISYLLPDLFSVSEQTKNLIETVIEKTKNDMAQGIFIRSLISMGEKNPDKATGLYCKLVETGNDD